MSPHRLEGIPWHISTPKMKENDKPRHKSRCIHYNKETQKCNTLKSHYGFRTCGGSRYCPGYEEREFEEESVQRTRETLKFSSSKRKETTKKEKNQLQKKIKFDKLICEKGDTVTAISIDNPNTIKTYRLVENEKGETLALKACYGKKRTETFIIKGKKYKILDIQREIYK